MNTPFDNDSRLVRRATLYARAQRTVPTALNVRPVLVQFGGDARTFAGVLAEHKGIGSPRLSIMLNDRRPASLRWGFVHDCDALDIQFALCHMSLGYKTMNFRYREDLLLSWPTFKMARYELRQHGPCLGTGSVRFALVEETLGVVAS